MLIEQVIEFELGGLGPLKFKLNHTFTRTCTVMNKSLRPPPKNADFQ